MLIEVFQLASSRRFRSLSCSMKVSVRLQRKFGQVRKVTNRNDNVNIADDDDDDGHNHDWEAGND